MGYFIMAIPAGLFISRFGYRRGVVFGLLLYGIGSLLFIPGQHYLSSNILHYFTLRLRFTFKIVFGCKSREKRRKQQIDLRQK
jgi:fucose permease